MRLLALWLAAMLPALPVAAEEVDLTPFDGSVEDAVFVLESAIVGEGLVVEFTSHVGEMLERTGADLGAGPSPVGDAQILLFCSATVSREVMEADPTNIANCPYSVFAAAIDGRTVIGHRTFSEASMAPVNELLARIVAAATE